MSDPPKSSGGFSFGTSAPSGGSNIFGSNNATGASIFGGNTSQGSQAFGASSSAAQSSGTGLFSTTPGNSAAGSNINGAKLGWGGASTGNNPSAGGAGNNSSSMFSALSTPNKTSDSNTAGETSKPTNPFGASGLNTIPNNLFGKPAPTIASSSTAGTSTPAPNKLGAFNFTNISTTPAGPPPAGDKATGAPAISLFGNNKPQQTSGLFGGVNTLQGSSSQATPASAAAASPLNSAAQQSSSNIFGSIKPIDPNAATSKPPSSSNMFGGAAAQNQSLFGSLGASSTSSPISAFSNPQGSQQVSGDASGKTAPSLSQNIQSPNSASQKPLPSPSQPAGQSPFGGVGNSAMTPGSIAQASSTSSSQPPRATASGTGMSNIFGGLQNQTPSTANTANTTGSGTSNLFSKLGSQPVASPTAAASSTQPSLFSNFGSASKEKSVENTQTQAVTTPRSSATATASAPLPSLFNPSSSAATTQAAAATAPVPAPTTTARPEAAKAPSLGASTSGPRPTPQSRLKNKSMDEIITRWASDLSKYQKEFQKQAEKVAEWDRILVDNSDKITKLYGSTLEAERATVEVERQLSSVENDQAELEYWLDHYEKQVDELMSNQVGQGDSLQGPDQERERTYKLAERLSDRLDEMGKDLTSMIEEINDASSSLSKTSKADDPLSQIVRVLNGHLSQLQQIDQGTAALQAQVSAAQKASRSLGYTNGNNGFGNDAADDFYRSYMGRR